MSGNFKELIFSSNLRTTGNNENFYVTIDENILPSTIKGVKLLDCFIPYSWYTISSTNNQFTLSEPTSAITSSVTISLTQQYYDTDTLGVELQSKLNANSPNTLTYTVTFNIQTLKYKISTSTAFTIDFSAANTCYKQLGFLAASYSSSSNIITAPNMASFVEDKYLYIHTNLIGGIDSGVQVVNGTTAIERNILAAVPIYVGFSNVLYYKQYNESRIIDSTNSSYNQSNDYSLHFWLSLSSGDTINLNGHFWTMKLLVEF